MSSRTTGTRLRRTQISARGSAIAVLVAGALAAGAIPAATAAPNDPDKPVSAWGKDRDKAKVPPVKVGKTQAPKLVAQKQPSDEVAAWRAAQKERAGTATGKREKAAKAVAAVVPKGQGEVPYHQISDVRVTDSLVARINYSTGNLMLAGTDLQVAGVGQSLQLSRTYNSLEAPWGKVSQRWWQNYERYLQVEADQVVLYDATAGAVTFTKKADGTYTTAKGYRLDLKKTDNGAYTVTERGSGSKDTYSASGTLLKVTDRNKGDILVEQHDTGTEHTGFKLTDERSGRFIDLVKNDASQWQAKDNAGRTVVYDLNGAGDLTKVTDTEGKATEFGYDTDRRLTKITTPEGRVTVFTYDGDNRVTSMKRATAFDGSGETGPTYTYAYTTDEGRAGTTKATDPAGNTTTYAHAANGEITKVTDALGKNRGRTYDANLNLETAVDAMGVGGTPGNVTAYGWDARSNATSLKLPTGATSSLTGYKTIAGADVPGKITSADGAVVDYTYDDAGNTTKETVAGAEGGSRTFTYNPADATCGGFKGQRCEVKDANGKATKFHYDAKGNLTRVTPPGPLGETTYTYDHLGRAETAVDGRGIKSVFVYDNRDRITKVSTTNTTVTYAYDGDGNLKQRSDSTGVTKYDFDPLSRETVRTLQDGSQTVLAYTAEGNVESYTDPAGSVKYTYDKVNRLVSLTDAQGKKTGYEYNANDARIKTSFPGGTVETVTRDKANRPERIKATSAQGTLVDLAYDYAYTSGGVTKDGTQIRSETDAVDNLKRTYTYDSAGRLTFTKETKGSATSNSWLYCYDKAGNLTSQGTAAGCPGGATYDYNDASQITGKNGDTSGWSYDKAGNETAGAPTAESARTSGTWSDHSQLTALTQGGKEFKGRYASTDNSERVQFGDTTFHHGPVGLSSKTTGGVDMDFTHEPNGKINSFRTETPTRSESTYYYLTDALGSTRAVVDDQGAKVNTYYYSPRGVTTPTEKVPQPHRFAGGYQDPTGLYHLSARYMDPRTGRFTQQDPSGLEANPYLYASGDPANMIDPSGLWGVPGWAKSVASTAVGVVVGGAAVVAVGAACGATAGAACLFAGAVTGALWGGAAGAGMNKALGQSPVEGLAGGITGGLLGPWAPGLRPIYYIN
ncbi:RHS repeat-associated core domain-containing protein [Streptomyces rectiviolaceus]|uniref:RHS repeat-associated core domain-containing protein n=1 Tax=Streptomyces rectiviolaceus TaxID=332591 RepID=A0ABP6NC90_9ACTN